MRDPNRLYDFYSELQKIHITFFPDWCFGQLISNFLYWLTNEKNIDSFLVEDKKMIKHIREYTESFGNEIV